MHNFGVLAGNLLKKMGWEFMTVTLGWIDVGANK